MQFIMMKSIHELTTLWHGLSDQQKIQRLWLTIAIMAVTLLILAMLATIRKTDVETYRERVNALEARIAVIDQKILNQQQRTDRVIESLTDTRHLLESEVLRNNEQDRVLETGRMVPRVKRPTPPERPPALRPQ